jgi:hypothetical protein
MKVFSGAADPLLGFVSITVPAKAKQGRVLSTSDATAIILNTLIGKFLLLTGRSGMTVAAAPRINIDVYRTIHNLGMMVGFFLKKMSCRAAVGPL